MMELLGLICTGVNKKLVIGELSEALINHYMKQGKGSLVYDSNIYLIATRERNYQRFVIRKNRGKTKR